MRKQLFISAIICILFAACGAPKSAPTASPSATSAPSSTVTLTPVPTITPKPTRTKLPATPTFTPFPSYPTKNVIFEYTIMGNHSYFDVFYLECCDYPEIILYDDGQIIVGDKQKVLSPNEIKQFFSKLDDMGFFSLESNQQYDPTDKLYDFGGQYEEINDGQFSCILVEANKSRQLCVHDEQMQFVIPKMKKILKYLGEYKPAGLTPYRPDRILVSIDPASSDQVDQPATPWNQGFPSLDIPYPGTYPYDNSPIIIIYVEGDMANEIYKFLSDSKTNNIFIQNHKKYIVYFSVVFPHQTVVNAYQ